MDRERALRMLWSGPEGVRAWNLGRQAGQAVPTLQDADLSGADLRGINLRRINLSMANLGTADLRDADLRESNLRLADLRNANLGSADLRGADLTGACLVGARLYRTRMRDAVLTRAACGYSQFVGVDLAHVRGLESARHAGPSHLAIDTLMKSRGRVPQPFLRGCGVPDPLIAALPAVFAAMGPAQFCRIYIGHSARELGFAERLMSDLREHGLGCWLGAPGELRSHDKFVLATSRANADDPETARAAEAALEAEPQVGRPILFALAVDDALDGANGWVSRAREANRVLDFRRWQEDGPYRDALGLLVRRLDESEDTREHDPS